MNDAADLDSGPCSTDTAEQLVREAALWTAKDGMEAGGFDLALSGLAQLLRDRGLPIDRLFAITPLIHPEWMGLRHLWRSDGSRIDERRIPHGMRSTDLFQNSPLQATARERDVYRYRIHACPERDDEFPILKELREQNFTDYLMTATNSGPGLAQYLSWATQNAQGFSDNHIAALDGLGPVVRMLSQVYGDRLQNRLLLDAYIGGRSGGRVRSGEIRRGFTQRLRAVLWFSDLRGFTALSEQEQPEAVISLLNAYFDAQCTPIDSMGGEILKFMGDGLMAVFPIENDEEAPRVAEAAYSAVEQAQANIRRLSRRRETAKKSAVGFGVALHVGEVAYGNIGAANRLDFTVIGAAVNQAARIEALCGRLGHDFLASEAFAAVCPEPLWLVGGFEVKGVAEPMKVFARSRWTA